MLTRAEILVLEIFREYLVAPGEMLCFHGPQLQKLKAPLRQLIEKKLLLPEQFRGGYSLTPAGYRAMHAAGDERAGDPRAMAADPRPRLPRTHATPPRLS